MLENSEWLDDYIFLLMTCGKLLGDGNLNLIKNAEKQVIFC